jgi:K+-transporting ATPase KdpF subunit
MTLASPLGYVVWHMSGADLLGLVVTVLILGYLLYALLRGERF